MLAVFSSEMAHINKIFFYPVGVPGMGKTTLSKHVSDTIVRFNQSVLNADDTLDFNVISYDKILHEKSNEYIEAHADADLH